MVDEEGGSGRGGLHAGVGDEVQDGLVALMADAHDDGQGHLRDGSSEVIAVEVGEVAGGTAATDDDSAVPAVGLVGNGGEGC